MQQNSFYSASMFSGGKLGSSGPELLSKMFSDADNDQGHSDMNLIWLAL